VLRKRLGPRRDEITGDWRKPCSEELHDSLIHDSVDKIKAEMSCKCITYSYGGELHTGFWWGRLKERDHLEHTGTDGRIILKWVLKKQVARVWTLNTDKWWSLISRVPNLGFNKMRVFF
jgi:hypothetical protein